MSKIQTAQSDAGVLAVIHQVGRTWRVLIASVQSDRPSILEAVTLREDEAAAIESHLDRHRVGRVLYVLPASRVVCRTCTLPAAEPAQLAQALGLQAEAYLLGQGLEHRTAMAVLPAAPGETSRAGIILCWPEGAPVPSPPTDRPVRFAPEIAGLAALLNGLRPTEPLLWLDRAHGSVALAVTHANGAVFRGTRETATSGSDWSQRVTRILAETALNVGHTGPFAQALVESHERPVAAVGPDAAAFLLPEEVVSSAASRLDGAGRDAAWWSGFGIAAGILLAASGDLAALTDLRAAPDVKAPSRMRSVVETLSKPRNATITAIACLVIIGILPLVVSGLRLSILKLRYPDINQQTRELGKTRAQLAMYAALEDQAWSMTKLLADIVSNTPEGIDLESIRIQQSDGSFQVSGLAKPYEDGDKKLTATENVALMQQNLRDSLLFGEIDLNWGDANRYGHYQFDMSAKIVNPHRRPSYAVGLDFGRWTLADRQADRPPSDVPGAAEEPPGRTAPPTRTAQAPPPENDGPATPRPRATAQPRTPAGVDEGGVPPETAVADAAVAADDEDGGPARPSHVRGGNPGGGPPRDAGSITDRQDGPAPGAATEPLTQAMIDAMSMEDVIDMLSKVSEARRRARNSGDEALQERLKNEFDMLMKRRREG